MCVKIKNRKKNTTLWFDMHISGIQQEIPHLKKQRKVEQKEENSI